MGWPFSVLLEVWRSGWWPRSCLNSCLNRTNPHQANPPMGPWHTHFQPWRGPIRRNSFDRMEMTLESTSAEVFVSHPFSSMYFFTPPNQQKRYLSSVWSFFLKDSHGQSFQRGNIIYFAKRKKTDQGEM